MFVILVTITIILPVSYARMVIVQRNLTLTVTGGREMNKVRCRACGSARTPSAVTTSPGWRGKQPSMGRKLGYAELNRLARTRVEAAAVAGSRAAFPGPAVRHVKQNLCKKNQNSLLQILRKARRRRWEASGRSAVRIGWATTGPRAL